MRKIIYAMMIVGGLSSCQSSKEMQPDPVVNANSSKSTKLNLKTIEQTSSFSKVITYLQNESGERVTSARDLKPNTRYQIQVEGLKSAQYVIRNNEGFEVLGEKTSLGRTTYYIKTSNSLIERLYISLVPVVSEHNKLKKQNAQAFLIPEN